MGDRGRKAGLVAAAATRNPGPFALLLSTLSSKLQKVKTHPYLQVPTAHSINRERRRRQPSECPGLEGKKFAKCSSGSEETDSDGTCLMCRLEVFWNNLRKACLVPKSSQKP